jgi:hypothetical protein
MTETTTISLAGKEYEIEQLNLDQLTELGILEAARISFLESEDKRLEAGGAEMSFDEKVRRTYSHNRSIVAAALSERYPEVGTYKSIGKLKTNPEEIYEASQKIVKFSVPQDKNSGEAPAPAETTGE